MSSYFNPSTSTAVAPAICKPPPTPVVPPVPYAPVVLRSWFFHHSQFWPTTLVWTAFLKPAVGMHPPPWVHMTHVMVDGHFWTFRTTTRWWAHKPTYDIQFSVSCTDFAWGKQTTLLDQWPLTSEPWEGRYHATEWGAPLPNQNRMACWVCDDGGPGGPGQIPIPT